MVWCRHCGKNVSGIRPYDSALACDLCGRILEAFKFSTDVTFVKNAAGQCSEDSDDSGNLSEVDDAEERQQQRAEEANMPPPATVMEAVSRMVEKKKLSRLINPNVLEELFDASPVEKSPKRSKTKTDIEGEDMKTVE